MGDLLLYIAGGVLFYFFTTFQISELKESYNQIKNGNGWDSEYLNFQILTSYYFTFLVAFFCLLFMTGLGITIIVELLNNLFFSK